MIVFLGICSCSEQEELRARSSYQIRLLYEKASLGLDQPSLSIHDKFFHLGYYQFLKREYSRSTSALIVTNSDQIQQAGRTLIESLPMVTFRIAAVTEMSSAADLVLSYPNVVLIKTPVRKDDPRELYQLPDLSI